MKHKKDVRRGAAMIEMAFVLIIFIMLLFGILEYSRLVFTRQIIFNASREGARYAVVNIYDTTIVTDTQAYVKARMCGLDKLTSYYVVTVYKSSSTGTNIGNAGDASFGDYIAVQIDYDYKPILPALLFANKSTIRITSRDLMYSEAN